jgi:hypothetical protein
MIFAVTCVHIGCSQSSEVTRGTVGVPAADLIRVKDGSTIEYGGIARIAKLVQVTLNEQGEWVIAYKDELEKGDVSHVYYIPVTRKVYRNALKHIGMTQQ